MTTRKPIKKTEGRRLDRQIVAVLSEVGRAPRRKSSRVLVDVTVDKGRVFSNASLKERWLFSSCAAGRAAGYAGTFDLFRKTADLQNLQHYILRPKSGKAKPADLEAAIKKLADDYDDHVGKLIEAKLLLPLMCAVHIRFDVALGLFDLHMHCMWLVEKEHIDPVLKGIQTKFSTTWREEKKIRRPGALANYIVSWVLDHRAMQKWPRHALLAVWDLSRPKLIRPAGIFADFRSSLKGFRVVRDGLDTILVPIKKRKPASKRTEPSPKVGATLAYVKVKILGKKRVCAVAAVDGQKRLTSRQTRDIVERFDPPRPRSEAAYSTSKTGSTPPGAGSPSPAPPDSDVSERCAIHMQPGYHEVLQIQPSTVSAPSVDLCEMPVRKPIIGLQTDTHDKVGHGDVQEPAPPHGGFVRRAWFRVVRFFDRLLRRSRDPP